MENSVSGTAPLKRKMRQTPPVQGERAKKIPTDKSRDFYEWWWDGTPDQTYVTQRLGTAANSCGKVRNPAPTADNPTSSASAWSPTERISQGASSIPICGIEPASASPQSIVTPWMSRKHRAAPT